MAVDLTSKKALIINSAKTESEVTITPNFIDTATGEEVAEKTYEPFDGYVYKKVTVKREATHIAGNIKSGVSIGGIVGTHEGGGSSGELEITENGTYDVKSIASVVVNVPSITAEQWDGSYEEISSGYTLTINTNTNYDALSGIYYSLDNGSSWNEITLEVLTIENVSQIKIKSEFTSGMLNIGTTEGGSDINSCVFIYCYIICFYLIT